MTRLTTPAWRRRSWVDDPNWLTVDSGLDQGVQFDLSDPGYPLPAGCVDEWRVFKISNDYGERVWVLQAKRAS